MTPEAIAELIRPHLETAGFSIESIEVKSYDDGMLSSVPVADVHVSSGDLSPDDIHRRMKDANKAMNRAFGADIRSGYYSAAIGYDEVPLDQVLLEFDNLPFDLDPNTAPIPR